MPEIREIGQRQASANESPWIQREYLAFGYTSESSCMVAVLAHLQATIGNPPDINANKLKNIFIKEMRPDDSWRVQVTWGVYQRPYYRTGESSFAFEFMAVPGKVILPVAANRVYKHASDPVAVPTIYLIGDQGLPDEEPTGAEIVEPYYTETETHYLANSKITQAYKDTCGDLVGKTNQSFWKGKQEGEALLTGVFGSVRGTDDWEVTYRWSVKRNKYNETFPGVGIVVGKREGWDYIWPRYDLRKDDANEEVLRRYIRHLVVSQVYEKGDFYQLGIG